MCVCLHRVKVTVTYGKVDKSEGESKAAKSLYCVRFQILILLKVMIITTR